MTLATRPDGSLTILMLSEGLTLLGDNGLPVEPRGSISAPKLGELFDDIDVLKFGAYEPNENVLRTFGYAGEPISKFWTLATARANGAVVIEEILKALRANAPRRQILAELHRFARWVPEVFFRMPEVWNFIRRGPDVDALRYLRIARKRGRSDDSSVLVTRVFAIDLVATKESVSVAEACIRIADKNADGRSVGPESLANLHSKYGRVAKAIAAGFEIPKTRLLSVAWSRRFESSYSVYLR